MSKCKYVAKIVTMDTSEIVAMPAVEQISADTLPEITRQVRKSVKLVHGNLIRTALIEEGAYEQTTMGRKKSNADIRCNIVISVIRGIA